MIANYACPVCKKPLFSIKKSIAPVPFTCRHCHWMLAVQGRETASRRAWVVALMAPIGLYGMAWFLLPHEWRNFLLLPDIAGIYAVVGWVLGRVVYDRSIIITPIKKMPH